MSRSLWKPNLLQTTVKTNESKSFFQHIKRNDIITSAYLNSTIKIHNGIKFFELTISEKMLGFKFGEFAPTRKIPQHKKKKKITKKLK
jgi:small subunit ribosomal protein S19